MEYENIITKSINHEFTRTQRIIIMTSILTILTCKCNNNQSLFRIIIIMIRLRIELMIVFFQIIRGFYSFSHLTLSAKLQMIHSILFHKRVNDEAFTYCRFRSSWIDRIQSFWIIGIWFFFRIMIRGMELFSERIMLVIW